MSCEKTHDERDRWRAKVHDLESEVYRLQVQNRDLSSFAHNVEERIRVADAIIGYHANEATLLRRAKKAEVELAAVRAQLATLRDAAEAVDAAQIGVLDEAEGEARDHAVKALRMLRKALWP